MWKLANHWYWYNIRGNNPSFKIFDLPIVVGSLALSISRATTLISMIQMGQSRTSCSFLTNAIVDIHYKYIFVTFIRMKSVFFSTKKFYSFLVWLPGFQVLIFQDTAFLTPCWHSAETSSCQTIWMAFQTLEPRWAASEYHYWPE